MRRILALLCALLLIASAGCTKVNNPTARSANPPPIGDNNSGGGGY
jgi:hypothetical protein